MDEAFAGEKANHCRSPPGAPMLRPSQEPEWDVPEFDLGEPELEIPDSEVTSKDNGDAVVEILRFCTWPNNALVMVRICALMLMFTVMVSGSCKGSILRFLRAAVLDLDSGAHAILHKWMYQ